MNKRWPRAEHLILATVCFLGVFAAAENVVVEPNPKVVGPHLRLTVSLHGQPIKDVRLNCYSGQNDLKFVRLTNVHGKAVLPQLESGIYRIEAQFDNGVTSNVLIKVVKNAKLSDLALDLTPEFEAHQAWLATVAKLPIAASVKEFSGTVFDPSNATIPNADIRVVRKGMEFGSESVLQLKSDADGHFSAQLEPGEYIAFFSETGFRTRILRFAIAAQGEGALRVVLDVGSVNQSTVVAAEGKQAQNH